MGFGPAQGKPRPFVANFAATGDNPYTDVTAEVYTAIGVSLFVAPTNLRIACVAWGRPSGSATASMRLRDVTNAQTIAELTARTPGAGPEILDLSATLANIPSADAVFQWEAKADGPTTTVRVWYATVSE